VVVTGGPRLGDARAGMVAAGIGATASWVTGGVACAVLVIILAIVFPALRRYTAPRPAADDRPPTGPQESAQSPP
jgi:hypothetical protein